MKKRELAAWSGLFALAMAALSDCRNRPPSPGKALAEQYCGSCHLPPDPALLDSTTWIDDVLPNMALKLGIRVWNRNSYYVVQDSSHPAILPYAQWMELVNYYRLTAPKKLQPAKAPVPLEKDWSSFRLQKPVWKDTATIATTTLVKTDTITGAVYSGDGNGNLYRWDKELTPVLIRRLPSPPVDIYFQKENDGREHAIVTCIGHLHPSDIADGEIRDIRLDETGTANDVILAGGLPRPVRAVPGDFNKDGLTDWIVCGFGFNNGGLYLLQQTSRGTFVKKSIREVPGAEQAAVGDFNHDGWPDVMVLFAQADEGIWLFLNDHHGGFRERNLLRFPPVWGSTSFQLADFNHDGLPDILYTCGDNGDFSQVLKPYHGMYIFLNEGNFRFKQAYFYPVNGCTKAVAADFGGNGRADIFTIAFFADFRNNPEESFIYFEQDRPMHFIPHAVPVYPFGRWLTMDLSYSGHPAVPKIVLGNFSIGAVIPPSPAFRPGWDTHLPLIVLTGKKKGQKGNFQ